MVINCAAGKHESRAASSSHWELERAARLTVVLLSKRKKIVAHPSFNFYYPIEEIKLMEHLFHYNQKNVRTLEKNGEVWFVAKDVCDILEIDDASSALRRIDPDERGTDSILTPSGPQEMLIVNESGLYALVLGSRKPEAKAFRRWITQEVLPQIRRTGKYDPSQKIALPLVSHTNREIQVAMSKAVSGFQYRRGGKLACQKYHARHCLAITGKTPKAVKDEGKKNNLPAKVCKSALEVLRKTQPAKASVASFDNHLVSQGHVEEKVFKLGQLAETVFQGMLDIGVTPMELLAKS